MSHQNRANSAAPALQRGLPLPLYKKPARETREALGPCGGRRPGGADLGVVAAPPGAVSPGAVLSLSEPPVPACLAQTAVETKLINTHLFSLILEIKLMPLINCAAQGRPPPPFSRDIQFKVKAGMGGGGCMKNISREPKAKGATCRGSWSQVTTLRGG